MDGQIIEANLQRTGKDRSWLHRQLKAQGIDELSEVFLAMADSENTCHIFPKQKNTWIPMKRVFLWRLFSSKNSVIVFVSILSLSYSSCTHGISLSSVALLRFWNILFQENHKFQIPIYHRAFLHRLLHDQHSRLAKVVPTLARWYRQWASSIRYTPASPTFLLPDSEPY